MDRSRTCKRCRGAVIGFRRAAAGASYRDLVQELVHRLKFGGDRAAAYPLACLAVRAALYALDHHPLDGVVAVPLHPVRLRSRGFNQAQLMAVHVAERLAVPFLPGVIRRVRHTAAQGAGGGGSRRENVRGAFQPVTRSLGSIMRGELHAEVVRGRCLLLVDDVLSTGATLDYCGRALLSAGAASVTGAVAAT